MQPRGSLRRYASWLVWPVLLRPLSWDRRCLQRRPSCLLGSSGFWGLGFCFSHPSALCAELLLAVGLPPLEPWKVLALEALLQRLVPGNFLFRWLLRCFRCLICLLCLLRRLNCFCCNIVRLLLGIQCILVPNSSRKLLQQLDRFSEFRQLGLNGNSGGLYLFFFFVAGRLSRLVKRWGRQIF